MQLLISPHAVQAAPIAVSDTFTTAEDTVLAIAAPGVLANDTSIEGPSLQAIFGSGPSHGTVILNRDGSFRYTPQSNYNGSDSFRYSVWDGARQSSTVAVNLTVTPVNDAPTGITLFGGTVPENVPLGTQAGWFTTQDPETTTGFTYTLSGEGAEVLEMFNVNYVRTKAGLDYETKRIYALRVRTTDSGGLSYEHDFVITVTNVNEAPTAVDDSYTPTEDMAMIVLVPGVMANDSDVDRDSLIARLLTGPVYGTLTLQANGSFTYVPVRDYCGSDAFTYEAWDGFLASAPATVSLMVVSVNDPPSFTEGGDQTVLEDCGAQTVAGWASSISAGPANESDQALDFIVTNDNNALFLTQPAVAPGGTLMYTPAPDQNGSATVTVQIHDNGGTANGGVDTSASQTFTITITPVNDPPVNAILPSISGTMNVGGPQTADPGIWNDTIDTAVSGSSTLTYAYRWVRADDTSGTNAEDIASATSSTHVLSNADAHKYLRVSVTCTDSGVGLPAMQSITFVTSWGSQVVNRLPVITEGASVSATIDEDSSPTPFNLTLNATDADLDTLAWSIPTVAVHGTAGVNGTGFSKAISYVPSADYNGSDSFVVQVSDGYRGTANITVNMLITEVNDAPTAVADAFTVLEDQTLELTTNQLLANDLKGPGNEAAQTLTVLGVEPSPVNCTVSMTGGLISVHLETDFNGTASFSYTVQDDGTTDGSVDPKMSTGTVTVPVTPVNDAPSFAKGADQSSPEDWGPQSVQWATSINAGPADEAAQALDFIVINNNNALFSAQPAIGSTGILSWTPAADMNGSATVTVQIHDNGGTANGGVDTSASQTFTITVTPVNDVPSFTEGGDQTVLEDCGAQTVPGWATSISAGPANESDQALDFIVINNNNGLFSAQPAIGSTGILSWTPAADANGTATITVRLHDDGGTDSGGVDYSAPQTFVITVTPVNDMPSFTKGGDQTVLEDCGAQTVPGWATAISNGPDDEADQAVNFSVTNDNTALFSVSPSISGTGVLTYTAAPNRNGHATVTVTLHDNGGTGNGGADTSASRTFTITILPVNDFPTFVKGSDQTVLEDCGPQTVAGWATAIQAGPADESLQSLRFHVAGSTKPSLFSVVPSISPDGTLIYTPDPDANGIATITVTLQDDGGTSNGGADTSASQTFTITVTPVNDMPSFTKGVDQTVLEDCGAQTVVTWATVLCNGPADEAAQALDFIVINNNNALFSTQPAIGSTGILTYTLAADMNGSATVTVQIHDNGGTANGGVDTSASQTFTITVTPVNDAPVNTALPAISGIPHVGRTLTTTEGAWNDLIDTSISGGTSILSYAYQWQRSTDGGSNFTPIAGATCSSYLLAPSDSLQQVHVQVTCSDTGVGLPVSLSKTAVSLPVTILNAAPVITEGPLILISCDEDESPVPFGLTLHETDSDVIDTLTWHIVTPPAHGTLTLPADPTVLATTPFYHPTLDWNGMDSFTLRVEDGLTGTATIIVSVTVNPRNDPPVNTLLPSIAGNLLVNHEVRAVVGSWNDAIDTGVSGTSVLSYTYQWLRASDAAGTGLAIIPGATASTYVVSPMDEGMHLAVRVTSTDGGVGLPLTMSTSADSAFLPARYLDMMPPTIELPDFSSWSGVTGASGGTTPSFTVSQSPFDLHFMVEDNRRRNVQWRVAVNGVETRSSTGIGTIDCQVPLTEGTNRVDIATIDEAGNRAERHFAITLDTHAPLVVLTRPLTLMVTGMTLNVEGSISDELSGVRSLTIGGTEVVPYLDGTFRVSLPLTRGINTITVETLDNVGNRGSFRWVIDLTPVQQPHLRRTIDLTIDSMLMVVDGTSVTMDVAPVIREDRTLLPLRALVQELGGSIVWNAMTRKVTVKARGITMVLTIGKNTATVNGTSTIIDPTNSKVVPVIIGGRTFLPVRFIAERLGLEIGWYSPARMVTITWEP